MNKNKNINKREKGAFFEKVAIDYLNKQKVRIVTQNFYCKQGEIDIIGYDETCLVFFEVKARDTISHGYPAESVNANKIKRISRASDYYKFKNNLSEFTLIRFDVILIEEYEVIWIKNAFDYRG